MSIKNKLSYICIPKFSDSGLIGLFLVAPILSLPFILINSYKRNNYSQIMLSVFIGLISICFVPPRADLYRIYQAFNDMNDANLESIINNLRFDFILPFSQYIALKIGMDFEIIRVISITFPYYLFLRLYNKLSATYSVNNKLLFFICILSVPFMEISLGIRHGMAISIISYVFLKKYLAKDSLRWYDYTLLVLAPCIHFGTFWFSTIVLISPLLPNSLPKIVIILLLISCYLIAIYIDDILSIFIFNEASSQIVSHYSTDGAYGSRFIVHNFIGSIPEYYSIFLTYFLIIATILSLPYNRQTKVLYCIIIIWLLTHSLYSLNSRISNVILVSFPLFYAIITHRALLVFRLLLLGALFTIIINWRAYTVSNSLHILYPLPVIIMFGYDNQWLKENVDQFGTLFIYRR